MGIKHEGVGRLQAASGLLERGEATSGVAGGQTGRSLGGPKRQGTLVQQFVQTSW